MVLYFCDCCGKKIDKSSRLNSFSWLCHLTDLSQGKYINGHVDSKGVHISNRHDTVELCNSCYNKIVIKSVKEFFLLKQSKGDINESN